MFEVAGQQAPASGGYSLTQGSTLNSNSVIGEYNNGGRQSNVPGLGGSSQSTQKKGTPRGWKVHQPPMLDHSTSDFRNEETSQQSRPPSTSAIKNIDKSKESKSSTISGQKPEAYSVTGQNFSIKTSKVRLPTSGHRESYVDESLFGGKEKLEAPDFPAPWENRKNYMRKPLYVFDATDYKAVAARKEAQQKAGGSTSRPQTPRSKKLFKGHVASYVDEGLFGNRPLEPDFKAPWDAKGSKKPFIFDTVDYTKPRSATQRPSTPKKPAWK